MVVMVRIRGWVIHYVDESPQKVQGCVCLCICVSVCVCVTYHMMKVNKKGCNGTMGLSRLGISGDH